MLHALTLHRPWAFAVAHLGKVIENRDWRPPSWAIGDWIAIHSGKMFDAQAAEWIRRQGLDVPENGGPAGAILCVAHLVGFVEVLDGGENRYPAGELRQRVEGVVSRGRPWLFGRYGWCFDEVVTLAEPVPCRGAQKLWRVPGRETAIVRERFLAARRAA